MAFTIWQHSHYHNEQLRLSQGSIALVLVTNISFLVMSADRNPVDYQNMDYNIWEELYIRNLLVLDNLVRQFIINFDN